MIRSMSAFTFASAVAGFTQGVTILEYQTAASTSNATLSPSVEDAAVAGDVMAAGSGISPNSGGTWNWSQWADGGSANTKAGALAESEIWTWGFDVVAALTTVSLTDFDIRVDRSGTGPNMFDIDYAINGGSYSNVLSYDFGDGASGVDFVGVDLSGISLSTGDSIEFRLVAWGADSGGASSSGTFDLETVDFGGSDPRSLRINGSVSVIPSPTAVLVGSAAIGGLALRRRRA